MKVNRVIVFISLTMALVACSNLNSTDPADVQGVDWADVEQSSSDVALSSSGVAPLSSSSDAVSSSATISSSGSSNIPEGALLVYDGASMGTTLSTGGTWQVYGRQGDGSGQSYTCGGLTEIATEQPADFGILCIDNQGVNVSFDIAHSADGSDSWGGAGLQANFLSGQEDVLSANKQTYDLAEYTGVCVTYNSWTSLDFGIQTTEDRQGDFYHNTMPANSALQKRCSAFSSFEKEGWSSDFDFDRTKATGIQILIDSEGSAYLRLKEIYFYQ